MKFIIYKWIEKLVNWRKVQFARDKQIYLIIKDPNFKLSEYKLISFATSLECVLGIGNPLNRS